MKNLRFCLIVVLVTFVAFSSSAAADSFVPVVQKYAPQDYHAANQNWALTQDSDGWIYAANSGGLLSFDGRSWAHYSIPGARMVRSVMALGDRIYAGALEEFGWFSKDGQGCMEWHSLSSCKGVNIFPNDEIWNIVCWRGSIIFHSFNALFIYDGQSGVRTVRLGQNATGIFVCADGLYLNFQFDGLKRVVGDFEGFESCRFSGKNVVAVLDAADGGHLVVTKVDGIYSEKDGKFRRFGTEAESLLSRGEINRAIDAGSGEVFLGTISEGAFLLSKDGKLLHHLSLDTGTLPNNTILGLFRDSGGNLWMALDNGIATFDPDSGMSKLTFENSRVGMIYSIIARGGGDYMMATNQGLYEMRGTSSAAESLVVRKVDGGQYWELYEGGSLFLKDGVCYAEGRIDGKDVLLQGSYSSISVYVKEFDGKWRFRGLVEGFSNPVRYMEIDHHGRVWCSHFYRGLYCLELSEDLCGIASMTKYDSPSEATVNVFKVNGDVVFLDRNSISVFDGEFLVPFPALNEALGRFSGAYRVSRCGRDCYWFITQTNAALVRVNNSGVKMLDVVEYTAFGENYIDDQQNIISLSDSVSLFCFENSLGRYIRGKNTRETDAAYPVRVYAMAGEDGRSMIFRWSAPRFSGAPRSLFSYGIDSRFSAPDDVCEVEYRALRPGKHRFTVNMLDLSGNIVSSDSCLFRTYPPKALRWWAVLCYLLVLALFIWAMTAYVTRKKVSEKERRIMALESENLKQQVAFKSKELASSTMSIIRKNEILSGLKDVLTEQKESLGTHYPDKYYNRVIRMIDDNISSDSDWEIFQTNFDRIHENFFRNLLEKYPSLTQSDLRLCAFLRLNMSTKDIANMLNITLKGVEAARYRLRKKLSLGSDVSLTEFLISLK